MSGALAILLAASALPVAVQGRSIELVGEARFVEALADAAREPDPLQRAQRELWVRHHAGDLGGALSAGLAELRAHPKDPFLLEQSAVIAIDLRRGEVAEELVHALTAVSASGALGPDESAAIASRVPGLLARTGEILAADRARSEARWRARAVALGMLAGVALLGALLAWRTTPREPTAS